MEARKGAGSPAVRTIQKQVIKSALVVGMGSAGRRHKKLLESLGYLVFTVDINGEQNYDSIERATELIDYSVVVIATPPDSHVKDVITAFKLVPDDCIVVCEKPLFGVSVDSVALDELERAVDGREFYVTYNYRFHKQISNMRKIGEGAIEFYSYQHRDKFPEWGIVVDHLPHTLDILLYLSDVSSVYECQTVVSNGESVRVGVDFQTQSTRVHITDVVLRGSGYGKVSFIETPNGLTRLEDDPDMFIKMWNAILDGRNDDRLVGFEDALRVNSLLGVLHAG